MQWEKVEKKQITSFNLSTLSSNAGTASFTPQGRVFLKRLCQFSYATNMIKTGSWKKKCKGGAWAQDRLATLTARCENARRAMNDV